VSLGRYALLVLALVGGTLLAAWPLLERGLEPRGRWAAVLGGGLAALNALAAYFLVVWSQSRPPRVFLGAVLGGMLGRMAFLLTAVGVAIVFVELPRLPLTVSLLAYFVPLLALELAILHRQTTREAR